jgi:hypothetical protein
LLVIVSMLPLSRKTLNFVAGAVRRHRKAIGSRCQDPAQGQEQPESQKEANRTHAKLREP